MHEEHGFLTRSQTQALAAFKCAQARARAEESGRDEYKTFAMRFPALVHSCGLAQAVVFAQRKHSVYLEDIEKILQSDKSEKKLVEKCINVPLGEYLHLTREVMQSAAWLKRYVEAEFAKKGNDSKEGV